MPISIRKQRKNLFGLRVKLLLLTTILTTNGKDNPAAYLQLKETTSELVCLFLHYSFYFLLFLLFCLFLHYYFYTISFMFNNKQENCDY